MNPYTSLQQAICSVFGDSAQILSRRRLAGGDINDAFLLELSDGQKVFLKTNTAARADFFRAEREGLCAIASTEKIPTPAILASGTDAEAGISFLLLEYLQGRPEGRSFWIDFGHALAQMHRADTRAILPPDAGSFGFPSDNYIGSAPQSNQPEQDWISFFRQQRLLPQIRRASSHFDGETRLRFDRLLDHLPDLLAEPDFPSLLHGDLWGGNFCCGSDGRARLIDPAVYIGHFEADLAMTELFGGFSPVFYQAYDEVNPIDSGYRHRRDLYNLYHMLNHLNLFGHGYLGEVLAILRKYT